MTQATLRKSGRYALFMNPPGNAGQVSPEDRELSEERTQVLQAAKHRAEQADRLKSQFVAHMSHEMRTPLNAMLGLTEMLFETQLDPDQAEMLQTIQAAGRGLMSLVNDLLDLSRVEAGATELDISAFRPDRVVDEVCQLLEPGAHKKGLHLQRSVEAGLRGRSFVGDPHRLRQILLNILGNAIKFTETGTVEVSLQWETDAEELQVWVRDTGPGISAEDIQRIFEPFAQVGLARTHEGTGLGLTISRRLAELMEGRLEVESRPGIGSTFRVFLPFDPSEPATSLRTPRMKATQVRPGLRVLLAEDNPVNVKVAQMMLSRFQVALTVAKDGQEALDRLGEAPYDLVLMDLNMPRLDGVAATRQLRARGGDAQPWVVAVTAHGFDEHRQACREAGFDDFLTKPLSVEALKEVLCQVSAEPVFTAG